MFGFWKKKKQKEPDLEKLIEIADILTDHDPLHGMDYCVRETEECRELRAESFAQRGMDVYKLDRTEFCWICLADELEDAGWLVCVDTACEAEDLRWSLSQLNLVKDMGLTIPELEADELYDWLVEYKLFFLEHGLLLCEFCMDSDDYYLILVRKEQYETVFHLAQMAGQAITEVD